MSELAVFAEDNTTLIGLIGSGELDAGELPPARLQEICEELNLAYRTGEPLVENEIYDEMFVKVLRKSEPENAFFGGVEPEPNTLNTAVITHTRPMLSTDKVYERDELVRYMNRILEAAETVGIPKEKVTLRATPKLDGIACRDYGDSMVLRGNGLAGEEVTHILNRGARIRGEDRSQGDGEIVVNEAFFQERIKDQYGFRHSRGFVWGFISADTVTEAHRVAADAQALVFVPFNTLPEWHGTPDAFLADYLSICDTLEKGVEYRTDGVVVEASDQEIREFLGATSEFHRWMVAIKRKGQVATTSVKGIVWQTGRTGRITPVVEVEPVEVSDVTISRVTAHHAEAVTKLAIGVGAHVEIIRSGEVIPKIERVLSPAESVATPHACPSCGHDTVRDGPFLLCPNSMGCDAQLATGLRHFFKTLGTVDHFGPATIQKIIESGVTDLRDIYALSEERLATMGFGQGEARRLVEELQRSKSESVEDWRFLASFGIRHLGRGDSQRFLQNFTLDRVVEGIGSTEIEALKDFGVVTSASISKEMASKSGLIDAMLKIIPVRATSEEQARATADSPVLGKSIVFTGTMQNGNRETMKERARNLGANVQSGVNAKTDYLVCGEKVGAKKIEKAKSLNVEVLTEAEYQAMIGN